MKCTLYCLQYNQTLLHRAAGYERCAVMGPIVAKGGDLEAREVAGSTPLSYACFWGKKESALALVGMGADPSIMDNYVSKLTIAAVTCNNNALFIVSLS